MNSAEHQILNRIGFAERWLQRAREQCLDGDVARGVLTLVLADAEVRRVLQLAAPPARRTRSPWSPALAGMVVLIVTAAAVQFGALTLGAAPVESAGLVPGLTLRAGSGALLEPLEAADAALPGPVVTALPAPAVPAAAPGLRTARRLQTSIGAASFTPPAGPIRAAQPAPVTRPASGAGGIPVAEPVPSGGATATHPPASPVPVPAVSSAQAPAAALTTVDLLDLVIVADRTLRRSQP